MIHVLRCEEVNENVCKEVVHNCMTKCFGFSPDPSKIEDIDHRLIATFPNHDKLQILFRVDKVCYKLIIMADPISKIKYTADIYVLDFWEKGSNLTFSCEFRIDTFLGISFN